MPSLPKVSSLGTELGALGCKFLRHDCLSPLPSSSTLTSGLLSWWRLCSVDNCRRKILVPRRQSYCLLRDTEHLPEACGLQTDLPTLTLVKLTINIFFFFINRAPFLCLPVNRRHVFGPRFTRTTMVTSNSEALCRLLSVSHMLLH